MRLVRLEIQSLPGISPGFSVEEFQAGANLVTGPNASGKSSLVRALRYLIEGSKSSDPLALSLLAEFVTETSRWSVRRTGSAVVWEEDGRDSPPPPLPGKTQLAGYWLSMEDLLKADESDQALLVELRRALSGGYDLQTVLESKNFTVGARQGMSQAKALREAVKERLKVENDYEVLRQDEEKLPDLQTRIHTAEQAARRAEEMKKVRAFLAAEAERQGLEAGLKEFPDGMDRLRGDELKRLADVDQKRADLTSERDQLSRAKEAALKRSREAGFADGLPAEEDLQARGEELERIRSATLQRENDHRDANGAIVKVDQVLKELGSSDGPPQMDPRRLSELDTSAQRLMVLGRECEELERDLHSAPEAPDPNEVEAVARGVEILRARLQWREPLFVKFRWGVTATIVLAGGAAVAAGMEEAWWGLGLAAGAGLVMAALLLIVFGRFQSGSHTEFAATGLEPPRGTSWAETADRLKELETQASELSDRARRADQAAQKRLTLARRKEELSEVRAKHEELARAANIDPELVGSGINRLMTLLDQYQEAEHRRQTVLSEVERLDGEIGDYRGRVLKFLAEWDAAPVGDRNWESLKAAFDGVKRRARAAADARRAADEAERGLEEKDRGLQTLVDEEALIIEAAGLTTGDRAVLAERLEKLETWQAHRKQLQDAKVREATLENGVENCGELVGEARRHEAGWLDEEEERLREQAAQAESLREELHKIRAKLEAAGKNVPLEKALADEEQKRAALEDEFESGCFAHCGRFLLRAVQSEYKREHEPAMLSEARQQFATFTHHQFGLEIDEEAGGFMGRDQRLGTLLKLDELSSATRMQLLLAVRVAWLRHLEKGRFQLPLVLDEALTISDENRFLAVAQSLEQLARDEGRQVVYLTARPYEIKLWEKAAGHAPNVIDLAAARFGKGMDSEKDYSLTFPHDTAAPEGRTPEAYAVALGVPKLDPWQAPDSLHLFHLLRDNLSLLHRLLSQWHVWSLGQLEALLQSDAGLRAVDDDSLRKHLRDRCRVARVWVEVWRHGRGRRVDRIALEKSGAVSDTFIEAVTELAEARGGDAALVIEDLKANQVARFRAGNTEQLEEYFHEQGHLVGEEPWDREGRSRRVMESVGSTIDPAEVNTMLIFMESAYSD